MQTARTTSLQAYNLLLYRTALHPEFFEIEGRRRIEHGEYEAETWIFRGGHALRFEFDGHCITEVVTDISGLPERGLVTGLPCAGEKDHEAELGDQIAYLVSIQTETLTDHLYLDTLNEMLEHGRKGDGMMSVWSMEPGGHPNLSLLDVQRYADEVHTQSYHLRSDCGLVLRTQSMFHLKNDEEE
jgi:hypothetical protein